MKKAKKWRFKGLLMDVIPEQTNGELPLWDNFIVHQHYAKRDFSLYEYLIFLYFQYSNFLEYSAYRGTESFVDYVNRMYPPKKQATRKR